jgi:hypothetical protein
MKLKIEFRCCPVRFVAFTVAASFVARWGLLNIQLSSVVVINARLQEFLPAAKPVGYNELDVSTTLSGLPDMKWQTAVAVLSSDPPVVPILGNLKPPRPPHCGRLLSVPPPTLPVTPRPKFWYPPSLPAPSHSTQSHPHRGRLSYLSVSETPSLVHSL